MNLHHENIKKPLNMMETCSVKSSVSVSKNLSVHFVRDKTKGQKRPPLHEYFKEHQCHLPKEKLNTYQIKCNRFRKWYLNLTTVYMRDIRAKNMYRSYSALCAEKHRQFKQYPFSIHPFSILKNCIELFILLGLLAYSTTLAIHFSETSPQEHVSREYILLIFDVLYFINIIINFMTGYVEGKTCQYVVLDLKKIAIRYAKTWLIFDVISTFSMLPRIGPRLDRVHPHLLLMSTKLCRLPIQFAYLNNVITVFRVGVIKRTLLEILVLNWSYLTWNMFFQFAVEYIKEGSFNPSNPASCSWISIANIWNSSHVLRFTYTFDRAVGMLRKNSNVNVIEQDGCFEFFLIGAWIISKLLVCHCMLKFIVTLLGKESAQAKFFIMTKQVATLMNLKKFPPRIKQKIVKFYAIRFQSNYFAETKMMMCVTGQLREDILMHTGRQLVRDLEFLKQLPRESLLQIGLKLKIVVYIAGDIIFKIHTVGECLYFIEKGTVAIYSESGIEICHLEDGDYFGEIALVMKKPIRATSAVAVTNCELFRLNKEEFDSYVACYPTVYDDIKKVAMSRYERTCVLDEHHKAELKMQKHHMRKDISDIEGDVGNN